MSSTLIVPHDIVVRMLDQACATCRFSWKDPTGDLNCRKNPPQTTVILTPAPPPRAGLMPMPFSTFPIVRADYWCGQWSERGGNTPTD